MQKKEKIEAVTTGKVLKYYFDANRKYKWLFLINIGLIIIINITGLLSPYFFKEIIDIITNTKDVSLSVSQSMKVLGIIGIIYIINILLWRIFEYFTVINLEFKVNEDTFMKAFGYMNHHSYKFFSENFVGSLVRNVNKLVNAGETLMDLFLFELMSIFTSIAFILFSTFSVNIYMFLFFVAWLIVYIVGQFLLYNSRVKYDVAANMQDSKMIGCLSDDITNNFNIATFSSQEKEYQNFEREVKSTYRLRKISFNKKIFVWTLNGFMFSFLEIAIVYLCIKLRATGSITLGTFFLLQSLLMTFVARINGIANLFKRFFRSISDASEMINIMETPYDIQDSADAEDLVVSDGKIQFEDVGFYYKAGKYVFQNLSMEIKAGEKVALVGVSGSGKTTISRLLMRLYDIQDGKIIIDGYDISKVTQSSLRKQISLVPQEPILFHRTIAQNIAYGKPDATMEEIIRAAKLARADEFISRLENGYESLVGERGIKLSGGEKQRVAIARAMLQNNKILILDEATSSLDSESEMYIQQAIEEALKNKTAIVIAHRLSTIMKMDRIIVMQHGKIVEVGSHQELLSKEDGVYQKLWNIQSGGFLME